MTPLSLPPVIGHRGAAAYAPENTLAGFRTAAALGVRWVEFDARVTVDGVAVLCHDQCPIRTLGLARAVERTRWADLARRDAGRWFGPAVAGEPVPTLAETLALLAGLALFPNIEVKHGPAGAARVIEAVGAAIALGWPDGAPPPLLSSFDPPALRQAKRRLPDLPRGLNRENLTGDWRGEAEELGCVSVHVDHRTLTAPLALSVKSAGFGLAAYTVDDPARARELWSWGVDAIFSNAPDALLAARVSG